MLNCSAKAGFPEGTSADVRRSDGSGWWATDVFVPWALLPQLGYGDGEEIPTTLRLNLYRYDFPFRLPNGSCDRRHYELSAWSASGCGNCHLPQFFGVGVLG